MEAEFLNSIEGRKAVYGASWGGNMDRTSARSGSLDGTHYAICCDLIIVCCHATYLGDGMDAGDESQWLLQDFQRSDPQIAKPSDHETFIHHVITGAFAAENNKRALLMFSGGTTAQERVRSEAEGYEQVYMGFYGKLYARGYERSALESCATDSYQNLLFSILRFRTLTGRYPRYITVITHAFKEERFLTLHAPAIKWPGHRIRAPEYTTRRARERLRSL